MDTGNIAYRRTLGVSDALPTGLQDTGYPIVWILLLPFRIVGVAVEGVLEVVRGIAMLPVRLLRGPRAP